jgi:hypothetical protein
MAGGLACVHNHDLAGDEWRVIEIGQEDRCDTITVTTHPADGVAFASELIQLAYVGIMVRPGLAIG